MREKTVEKTFEITNTIKTYIAKDGKEFNDMNECMSYESELDLNCYADKYKIKFIEVPNFICNDNHVHGILFYFPQDGDKNEVIRFLSIFQNYEIVKKNSEWEIYYDRNLSNVRDSDFEIEIPFELNKGDNYVFYFCWEEYNDGYDYFWNGIISKEKAMVRIEEEIKKFEEIFGIKFEEADK